MSPSLVHVFLCTCVPPQRVTGDDHLHVDEALHGVHLPQERRDEGGLPGAHRSHHSHQLPMANIQGDAGTHTHTHTHTHTEST